MKRYYTWSNMPKSVRAKLNILAKARTIPTGSTRLPIVILIIIVNQ